MESLNSSSNDNWYRDLCKIKIAGIGLILEGRQEDMILGCLSAKIKKLVADFEQHLPEHCSAKALNKHVWAFLQLNKGKIGSSECLEIPRIECPENEILETINNINEVRKRIDRDCKNPRDISTIEMLMEKAEALQQLAEQEFDYLIVDRFPDKAEFIKKYEDLCKKAIQNTFQQIERRQGSQGSGAQYIEFLHVDFCRQCIEMYEKFKQEYESDKEIYRKNGREILRVFQEKWQRVKSDFPEQGAFFMKHNEQYLEQFIEEVTKLIENKESAPSIFPMNPNSQGMSQEIEYIEYLFSTECKSLCDRSFSHFRGGLQALENQVVELMSRYYKHFESLANFFRYTATEMGKMDANFVARCLEIQDQIKRMPEKLAAKSSLIVRGRRDHYLEFVKIQGLREEILLCWCQFNAKKLVACFQELRTMPLTVEQKNTFYDLLKLLQEDIQKLSHHTKERKGLLLQVERLKEQAERDLNPT